MLGLRVPFAPELDPERRRDFEAALVSLLLRFGAGEEQLREDVARSVDETCLALRASANDGGSLSPLDVLRIRTGKFAAVRLRASVYRDPAQLALLRGEIQRLAAALLGPAARPGSRF